MSSKIPFKDYARFLWKYLRRQQGRTLFLSLLIFSGILLKLANPQIMRAFIDSVQAGGEMPALIRLALFFLAIAFVDQLTGVLATYTSENVGWTATNQLRSELASHCLNLDLSFHNVRTPGEMIERIDGDVTALSNFFSRFMMLLVGNALLMAGVLALLFYESWLVGMALTVFVALTLFLMMRLRGIAVPHFAAERQVSAEMFGFLEERMSGAEDVRANGGKSYVMRRFYELMRSMLKKSLRAALMINILLNLMWTLFSIGTALAFALGAYLFQNQAVTIGTVYIIFQYANMLSRPIDVILHELSDLQRAGAGITRARELLALQPKITSPAVQESSGPPASEPHSLVSGYSASAPLALEFEQVTFGYDDNLPQHQRRAGLSSNGGQDSASKEMVLHQVSFHLDPGKVLGVLGRTGSGKTSLTRLIFRLYDPDQGMVRLGANPCQLADLRSLPLPWLRRQVGMVTQNIQLFQASVRDNLTFFDRTISDQKILDTLHDLGLGKWFLSLTNGLDSELASGDGGLSAGEGQLLAFVRIFLRDPGLVILDEASSRLDPATEHLIEQAVDRLLSGRTAVIVAHRLGTLQRADDILILEEGRVFEYGSRSRLLADPISRFYQLMQTGLEEVLV
jgi:ATP-binding cassette, subfamily B, bacterial